MCYLHRGTRLGSRKQYEVEAWLGFSESRAEWELFAARNLENGENVLVKAFPEDGSDLTTSVRSFENEARRVAELVHPSLASVLDFGAVDSLWAGSLFYVVEGCAPRTNLHRVLASRPKPVELEPLVRPLVDGVRYLKERDALADVALQEIYVPEPGQVKWGLFGAPAIPSNALPAALEHVARAYPELRVS